MRRNFSAILILFVFASIQYGRVAAYLYCKWQYEVVSNQKDCNCETRLADSKSADPHNGLSNTRFQDKPVEYFYELKEFSTAIELTTDVPYQDQYNQSLADPYSADCFHPPAA